VRYARTPRGLSGARLHSHPSLHRPTMKRR
jgi:hypothetical protein